MCFSAGASFGAAAVLGAFGIASFTHANTYQQRVLGAIPLLFSAQQVLEGILWLTIGDAGSPWREFSIYGFLIFAQVIWTTWVPLSMLLIERRAWHKGMLRGLLFIGLSVSAYLAWCLVYFPVDAVIHTQHIKYIMNFPEAPSVPVEILYGIATIVPPFFSSRKNLWVLGAAIFCTFIASQLFFEVSLVSVWCFFAAIVSIIVLTIVRNVRKSLVVSAAKG